jgi:hypothetical protein
MHEAPIATPATGSRMRHADARNGHEGRKGYARRSSPQVDRYPADLSAAHAAAPVRPDRLTVWPSENGGFGIDVRWYGRECILRAVVVRRLLSEAGYPATVGNSIDGRNWELTVGPVPADEVASVIESYIW